jgi:short-subunit dehydrogenase involved in D-alanine esterification of teichoic acids
MRLQNKTALITGGAARVTAACAAVSDEMSGPDDRCRYDRR